MMSGIAADPVPTAFAVPYQKLSIYQTNKQLYVVGYCKIRKGFALLRFQKGVGHALVADEDPTLYGATEINLLIRGLHEANVGHGGLQFLAKAHGIIACFSFTQAFYLLLITRKGYVGSICGHKIYKVDGVALLPLSLPSASTAGSASDAATERRYRKLLMGVPLTKNFYYSYTYCLANTMQVNCYADTAAAAAAAGVSTAAAAQAADASTERSSRKALFPGCTSSTDAPARTHADMATAIAAAAASQSGPRKSAATAAGQAAAAVAAAAAFLNDGDQPAHSQHPQQGVFESMFVWNSHLTSPLRHLLGNCHWVVPLVHGFWDQRQVSVFGAILTMTLLARRSRHFAGTRFKKRGLSEAGYVANEVETEQIIDAGIDFKSGLPLLSSMVQVRGSVPLFWSQEASGISAKPDIVLQQFDPLFEVTGAHFDDLKQRYGHPLVVLNLLKSREKRGREVVLRRELAAAVNLLNAQVSERERVVYMPWDFAKAAKTSGCNILVEMSAITKSSLDATGIFVHNPARLGLRAGACLSASSSRSGSTDLAAAKAVAAADVSASASARNAGANTHRPSAVAAAAATAAAVAAELATITATRKSSASGSRPAPMVAPTAAGRHIPPEASEPNPNGSSLQPPYSLRQHGILRTNCIDCLDRTNVAQFAYGLLAFGRQLQELGISDGPEVDPDSSIAFVLMEQYESMGHTLALQYGGSEAHSVFFERKKGEWEAATQSRDVLTSIRRFYSNKYTDSEKQDAINLFLGNFVPQRGRPQLWELDSDQYLHADPWDVYNKRINASHSYSTEYNSKRQVSQALKRQNVWAAAPSTRQQSRSGSIADESDLALFARSSSSGTHRAGYVPPTTAGQVSAVNRVGQDQQQIMDLQKAQQQHQQQEALKLQLQEAQKLQQQQQEAQKLQQQQIQIQQQLQRQRQRHLLRRHGSPPSPASPFTGVPRHHMTRVLTQPIITTRPASSIASLSSDDDDTADFETLSRFTNANNAPGTTSGPNSTPASASGASSMLESGAALFAAFRDVAVAVTHSVVGGGGSGGSSGSGYGPTGSGSGRTSNGWDLSFREGQGVWTSLIAQGSSNSGKGVAELREPGAGRGALLSFDALMARQPSKAWNIRLFGVNRQDSPALWQAVQGAFSFFWQVPDTAGTAPLSAARQAAITAAAANSIIQGAAGNGAGRRGQLSSHGTSNNVSADGSVSRRVSAAGSLMGEGLGSPNGLGSPRRSSIGEGSLYGQEYSGRSHHLSPGLQPWISDHKSSLERGTASLNLGVGPLHVTHPQYYSPATQALPQQHLPSSPVRASYVPAGHYSSSHPRARNNSESGGYLSNQHDPLQQQQQQQPLTSLHPSSRPASAAGPQAGERTSDSSRNILSGSSSSSKPDLGSIGFGVGGVADATLHRHARSQASSKALKRMTETAGAAVSAAAALPHNGGSGASGNAVSGFMAHHQRSQMGAFPTAVPGPPPSPPFSILLPLTRSSRAQPKVPILNDFIEISPSPVIPPHLEQQTQEQLQHAQTENTHSVTGTSTTVPGCWSDSAWRLATAAAIAPEMPFPRWDESAAERAGSEMEKDGEWMGRECGDVTDESANGSSDGDGCNARYADPDVGLLLTSDLAEMGLTWELQPWWKTGTPGHDFPGINNVSQVLDFGNGGHHEGLATSLPHSPQDGYDVTQGTRDACTSAHRVHDSEQSRNGHSCDGQQVIPSGPVLRGGDASASGSIPTVAGSMTPTSHSSLTHSSTTSTKPPVATEAAADGLSSSPCFEDEHQIAATHWWVAESHARAGYSAWVADLPAAWHGTEEERLQLRQFYRQVCSTELTV